MILEMSTPGCALAMITVGSKQADIDSLIGALERLPMGQPAALMIPEPPLATRVLPMPEAAWARSEVVLSQRAIGRVSAEIVAPCPPGIPLLTPGDLITPEIMTYLEKETIRVLC
jgi:arginine/lysine/ornithine decarboxylase